MDKELHETEQPVSNPSSQRGENNLPQVIKEIDRYLGETFDAMSVIDDTYGKVSSFFISMADRKVGDADYDQLSKEDQQEATLYMTVALAVQGLNAVTRGIKEAIAIEKVKRLHRLVAEERIKSLPRQIDRMQRLHDEAAATLSRHNAQPFRSAQVKSSFDDIADILEQELCQYRDARFRLDMLYWLKEEYEAWLDGRLFSDTPIPVMGQATIAAIYLLQNNASGQPPISATNLKEGLRKIADGLKKSLNLSSGFPSGKDFISAFEILAIADRQIAAVLEYFSLDDDPVAAATQSSGEDEEDFDDEKLNYNALYAELYMNAGSNDFPHLKNFMEKNPVTLHSMKILDAFYTMKEQYDKGLVWIGINTLLIIAAGVIPSWTFGLEWYWASLLSVFIIYLAFRFFAASNNQDIEDNLINKVSMMNRNYDYTIAKEAGLIQPESRLRQMVESRNHIFAGLIIGGLIGLILGPLGAIIGAIIGAIAGTGSSDEIDDHGEGWEEIRIFSPVKQCIVSIAVGIIVILEIIGLFS